MVKSMRATVNPRVRSVSIMFCTLGCKFTAENPDANSLVACAFAPAPPTTPPRRGGVSGMATGARGGLPRSGGGQGSGHPAMRGPAEKAARARRRSNPGPGGGGRAKAGRCGDEPRGLRSAAVPRVAVRYQRPSVLTDGRWQARRRRIGATFSRLVFPSQERAGGSVRTCAGRRGADQCPIAFAPAAGECRVAIDSRPERD
jgi:hypothetical protein